MHDAAVRTLVIKAVLMNEERKGTFDDFINQQMRPLHRLPATSPVHRNDPPIPAIQLNHPPLLRGAIGFQAD